MRPSLKIALGLLGHTVDTEYIQHYTPREIQIIGSDDCSSWTNVTDVLRFDPPATNDDLREVDVAAVSLQDRSKRFRCVGMRMWQSQRKENGALYATCVRQLRMWVKV